MTNLYEFHDLTAKSAKVVLMPEALTFGGVNIDEELAGYRTLNVSGRENFTRSVNTANSTADGELFISSKIDTAELTIKYQLNADTIDEFNRRYTQLKYWLQGEEKPFYFADENEFVRYGTVTSLNNDTVGDINTTGTITIKMTNPFRHGQLKTVSGTGTLVLNDPQMKYQQKIDKVYFNITTQTNTLTLTIDNYRLSVSGSFTVGSLITIDFNSLTIKQGTISILSGVNILLTDIFEAKASNGSTITSPFTNKINAEYRVRIL